MSQTDDPAMNDENGLDLWDIIDRLQDRWKVLALAAGCGLLAGVSWFYLKAPYQVQATIINNGAADFVSWRNLK